MVSFVFKSYYLLLVESKFFFSQENSKDTRKYVPSILTNSHHSIVPMA